MTNQHGTIDIIVVSFTNDLGDFIHKKTITVNMMVFQNFYVFSTYLLPNSDRSNKNFDKNKDKDNDKNKNIDETKSSPLAKQLFYLPFVKTIYISANFIASLSDTAIFPEVWYATCTS